MAEHPVEALDTDDEQEKEWKAENDCRTLIDAAEIKNDPERLKAAVAEAKKKMAALKEVGSYE